MCDSLKERYSINEDEEKSFLDRLKLILHKLKNWFLKLAGRENV